MSDLAKIDGAAKGIKEGDIVKMADLVKEVAPPAPAAPVPEKVPLPAVITDKEKEALAKLPEVFGSVVPTERRMLTDDEAAALHGEREVITTIEKMVKGRKDDIRTAVANHLDVLYETEVDEKTAKATPRDKDGFYIVEQRAPAAPGQEWSREPSGGGGNAISTSDLQRLVDDEDSPFTHQDLLAMTEPVRVVDENRFMLHLKRNPSLVAEVAKVATRSPRSATIVPRAAKR